MQIETLLYVYLFICSSMIAFNIVTAFVLKHKDKKLLHVSREFHAEVMHQLDRIDHGEAVEPTHKKYLMKKLSHIGNMLAFDAMLEPLYQADNKRILTYLSQISHVIAYLTLPYGRKDRMEAAYFAYIIKKYRLIEHQPFGGVTDAMLALLHEPSLYCRENAMQALYTSGDVDCIMRALETIDESDLYFHDKLLSDGLLNFAGDHHALCERIISRFDSFTPTMQMALMNFFRFDSGDFCAFALRCLEDEKRHDEVRYASIRYLGKHPYEAAYPYLLQLAGLTNHAKWEYVVVASAALGSYPGEATVEQLKRNLYNPSWYVRFNASQSLERLGLTYLDLVDVMEGQDRYATEILRYRFDIHNLATEGADTNV